MLIERELYALSFFIPILVVYRFTKKEDVPLGEGTEKVPRLKGN